MLLILSFANAVQIVSQSVQFIINIQMKDKLSLIHKQLRRKEIAQYFHQRRTQMTAYNQQQRVEDYSYSLLRDNHYAQTFARRDMTLNLNRGTTRMELEDQYQPQLHSKKQIDCLINFTQIDQGEGYLAYFMQSLRERYLQDTICLLDNFLSQVLGLKTIRTHFQKEMQTKLVYMTLKNMKELFLIQQKYNQDIFQVQFQNSKRARKILMNILQNNYKQLLQMQNSFIIGQLISISYELCTRYIINPNYCLIKYILIRIITKHNLLNEFTKAEEAVEMNHKIQELLMRYIEYFKIVEKSNNKMKHIHENQIIYDYHNYIQFNLVNVYQFSKNNEHPFYFEHINNCLVFVISLYTQLILKFKTKVTNKYQNQYSPLILIKPAITDLLIHLMIIYQKTVKEINCSDQFINIMEELTNAKMDYLMDVKSKLNIRKFPINRNFGGGNHKRLQRSVSQISEVLMMVKLKMKQMEQMVN